MASSPTGVPRVRTATTADLPRILEIERAASTAAHWTEADYEIALVAAPPRRCILVVESAASEGDFRVEGFLVARSGHPAEWEIENVVVAPTARRLGLGSALLRAFLEQVRGSRLTNSGPMQVLLEVRESNLAARQLYEKSGFVLDKWRRGYYRDPEESATLYHLIFQ